MGTIVNLTPNRPKIVEAILFLIGEAQAIGVELSQYDIVKSLFEADGAHLNAYGRPVTFDNYAALEHGPVARESYDMLKPSYNWQELGLAVAPWTARETGPKTKAFAATRPADLRLLSKTDQRVLQEAMQLVIKLGFKGVRERTHEHPAWKKAWESGTARSKPMDYALMFAEPDEEAVEHLAYASART